MLIKLNVLFGLLDEDRLVYIVSYNNCLTDSVWCCNCVIDEKWQSGLCISLDGCLSKIHFNCYLMLCASTFQILVH